MTLKNYLHREFGSLESQTWKNISLKSRLLPFEPTPIGVK